MPELEQPATGEPTTTVTPDAPAPVEPKPTETVEFWKKQSREQEARAKANADAAAELQSIKESQLSESQKQAAATEAALRDAAQARAEALAYRVAATHGVTPDNFDLLGTGDEQTIAARAERIGGLLRFEAENAQLKAELDALRAGKPAPAASRPVTALKPGASPENTQTEDDAAYTALFGNN